MKTSRLLSLVAGFAMVASVFTAAVSAAAVQGPDEKPVAKVVVNSVEDGLAYVDVMFSIDAKDFVAKSKKFDAALKKNVYKGKGIEAVQVEFKVNPEYFDTTEVFTGDNITGAKYGQLSNGNMDCTWAATSDDTWCLNNEFLLCSFIAITKDETITADFLAKCTDIVDFEKFTVRTKAYPVAGTTTDGDYEYVTYYRLDGLDNSYVPTVIEGAEKQPEPPVDNNNYGEAGNDFEGKATKYWKVDFTEWTGTADVSLTDGTTTKTINVTTAEGSEDYVIGGAVSFYVYVIGNDIANVYIVE